MKINFSNSPAFKAQYLNNVNIMKYNDKSNKYEPAVASFVELKDEDKATVAKLNQEWIKGVLIEDIYDDFVECENGHKVYAVTTQQSDLKNLDHKKILSIGEIDTFWGQKAFIEFLQANPDSFENPYFEYKKCGSAFLDGLKQLYKTITLKSVSLDEVINFYKNNGFIEKCIGELDFYWHK